MLIPLLACIVCAPQEPARDAIPSFDFGRTAAVSLGDDGRPLAIGPHYLAAFDAQGATFVPALGTRAPQRQDLVLEARELRRGATKVVLASDEPEARGDTVVFERAPGVEERFEATLAGLEHSFLVAGPVGSDGDLVVRVDVGGEVGDTGTRALDGSHVFAREHGGVSYGRLFGIDANGARCDGDVRLVPGGLELVLPASFVDAAAWPILLDPIVAKFELTQPAGGFPPAERDSTPSVAFDDSSSTYLVAWIRSYSNGDRLVHGQRFSATGSPSGSVFALSTITTAEAPRVANVNGANRFVVAWLQDVLGETQVRVRAVGATNSALSNTLYVGGAPDDTVVAHDLGAECHVGTGITQQAFSVWSTQANGVQMTRVNVPSGTTNISVIGTTTIAADPGVFESVTSPVISRAPSIDGRSGVVWVRDNSLAGTVKLYGTAVDRSGALVHSAKLVSGADDDVLFPEIDGGGANPTVFVVAWCDDGSPLSSTDSRVRAVSMTSGGSLTVGSVVTIDSGIESIPAPAVGWRPGTVTIAHRHHPNLEYRRLHPTTFATIESSDVLAYGNTSPFQNDVTLISPELCMNVSGGDLTEDRGVAVWTRTEYDSFSSGTVIEQKIHGAVFSVFENDATSVNLGGACGSVGTISTPQAPAIGNATFEVRLNPAPGALFAVLDIAPPQTLLTCGACSFVAPATTYLVPLSGSSVSVALPIPAKASLGGAQVLVQWYVLAPGTTPCALVPDFGATDVLELTIN